VNFLKAIPAALVLLSLLLGLWQWLAARRFPLHRQATDASFAPAISLLKPLKGCDATTAESLQSWFQPDYPGPVQLLFGIADPQDPAGEIVRRLIEKNPGRDAQLIVCARSLGANGKVSTLVQLEQLAKYELILVSDADVRVPGDFLVNVVQPLHDPKIGLVNCFYRLANPANLAMQYEAIAVNADFWSQVLQAATLQAPDFALGAVMLTRRPWLEEIGGFTTLVNCLADDYQLGHRIVQKGHPIALSPIVVECWDRPMNWNAVWKHQLRWARTIRVCRPAPYFFSILSNATFWPLVWLILSLAGSKLLFVLGAVAACILVRAAMARDLQRRLTPAGLKPAPSWLVPVKDLLQVTLWLAAFLGNTIEWRGQKMRLRRDGTLTAPS